MREKVKTKPLAERFWAKVKKAGPDECWIWQGHTDRNGYGSIRDANHRMALAHRVAWELKYGPIPEGVKILHSCDNPSCVNDGHLRPGTQTENIVDRDSRGRTAKGGRVGSTRLTSEQVKEIRKAYQAGGETRRGLAKKFGVAHCTVNDIVHRVTWKEI